MLTRSVTRIRCIFFLTFGHANKLQFDKGVYYYIFNNEQYRFISQGTEINCEVKHGRNALHYAADAGKVPIVRFLLGKMAIIDVSRAPPSLFIT